MAQSLRYRLDRDLFGLHDLCWESCARRKRTALLDKAAHYWNQDFGRGDLFLESGDVHWAFYLLFGWLTKWLTMEQSVWILERALGGCFPIGWTSMLHSLFSPLSGVEQLARTNIPFLATLVAPIWLAGMHWGLWRASGS